MTNPSQGEEKKVEEIAHAALRTINEHCVTCSADECQEMALMAIRQAIEEGKKLGIEIGAAGNAKISFRMRIKELEEAVEAERDARKKAEEEVKRVLDKIQDIPEVACEDGSGCDSGDEADFVETQVKLAIAKRDDKIESLSSLLLLAEEALNKVMNENQCYLPDDPSAHLYPFAYCVAKEALSQIEKGRGEE